ncbi:MAG: hypothetical protein ABI619_08190, partial [Betaproteobacteria bacterium]
MASQDKVKAGDIVLLTGSSNQALHAIDMGEELFPAAMNEDPRSFFIYELAGSVMYSTLPPRADKQAIAAFLKSKGKALTADRLFSPYKWANDTERRNVQWLAASNGGKPLLYGGYRNVNWLTKAKVAVFRGEPKRFVGFSPKSQPAPRGEIAH